MPSEPDIVFSKLYKASRQYRSPLIKTVESGLLAVYEASFSGTFNELMIFLFRNLDFLVAILFIRGSDA